MADTVDAEQHEAMDTQAEATARAHPAASQRRSSDSVSDCYKMNHDKRGMAVIINNKNFDPSTKMGVREGTDVDANAMYSLLDMLGFESIKQYDDQTAAQIKEILKRASNENHTRSDCFVCVILSHGDEGFIHGYDRTIAIDDLVRPFKGDKCPSLAGKPKLFFIQACRGTRLDEGVTVADAAGEDEVEIRRIPTEADFLMAYSIVPGFYSWRNSAKGSWFIQALVKVFTKYWKTLDVLTMMTRVNKIVAFDFESKSNAEYMSKKKQIPCITSMLTKDVYFYK
ncbi:hypothetical protein BsWGS_20867 [Bradybaena similaris]